MLSQNEAVGFSKSKADSITLGLVKTYCGAAQVSTARGIGHDFGKGLPLWSLEKKSIFDAWRFCPKIGVGGGG